MQEKWERQLRDDINIDVKLLNFYEKTEFKGILEKNNRQKKSNNN